MWKVVLLVFSAAVATSTTSSGTVAPFGTRIGVTMGPTDVYSCDNPVEDDPNFYPEGTDDSNGTYTGLKWQCVELARRFLFINHGLLFASVDGAVDIFNLTSIAVAGSNTSIPFVAHPQGGPTPPVLGSLLIYDSVGKFSPWGHVAVVVNVADNHIDIAEQNVENTYWAPGAPYSRRLSVTRTPTSFTVMKYFPEPEVVLGWMTAEIRPAC
ncbi:bifunctional glutathionylspermidine amidase/glutathionylspermidine synthetase [Achlya hypogyna]|uniref:Bifunctional glutathionylspermidine amidase/glutathionylspermidine synthetase n=1 Tax=Achlya hypogyna TaxID=1202772 RepID=A0A1V9ZET3_ACHHY|nr:bifunctional glutathionylspermidine amidase/glutathionylspermidine synthetase [Achlya hypogyna]